MSKREASPATKKKSSDPAKKEKSDALPDVTDDEIKAALKTGGWKEMKQESTGKTYYYHKATKATTWDLKKELAKQKQAAQASASPAKAEPEPAEAAASPPAAAKKAADVASTKSSASSKSAAPSAKATAAAAAAEAAEEAKSEAAAAAAAEATAASESATKTPEPAAAAPAPAPVQVVNVSLKDYIKYTDPLQRLVNDNNMLQHLLATGSKGEVALDFQAKYDAMQRTNQALTVQMSRMKTEYDAMQRALNDANIRVHQLQLQVAEQQHPTAKTKDQELQLTMAHLREQNTVLVQEVGELSMLLARGLNEAAFRIAGVSTGQPPDQAPPTQSAIISRFLESAGRQVLCTSCLSSVSKARDALLHPSESNVGAAPPAIADKSNIAQYSPLQETFHGSVQQQQGGVGASIARTPAPVTVQSASQYTPSQQQQPQYQPQLQQQQQYSTPQPSFGFVQQQQQQYSAGASSPAVSTPKPGQIGAAPVMYGGFVVRNNRGPA